MIGLPDSTQLKKIIPCDIKLRLCPLRIYEQKRALQKEQLL